jgi:hypothetical protein
VLLRSAASKPTMEDASRAVIAHKKGRVHALMIAHSGSGLQEYTLTRADYELAFRDTACRRPKEFLGDHRF